MATMADAASAERVTKPRRTKAATTQAAANPDVYTMAEAARLKGVSYHTVSRAVRRGKLPAQRLGRMALITADDLRDWRPMRERAPRKYRRREPDPGATPALLDLASGERVSLAQRLSTLFELIHGAASQLPLDEFLSLLTDRFASALDLRRVAIWVTDDHGKTVRRIAHYGSPMSDTSEVNPDDLPWVREVLDSPEAVRVLSDVGESGIATDGVSDVLVAPLRASGRLLGVVVGDRGGPSFSLTEDQTVLAEGLANQAALALDRARLRDEQARRTDQLEAIIENVAEVVLAIDAGGNVTAINRLGRDLYGINDQIIASGGGLDQAVHGVGRRELDGRDIPTDSTPLMRAIKGENVRDRRYVIIRHDGRELPVSVNAQPILNAEGEVTGAVAILRPIEA